MATARLDFNVDDDLAALTALLGRLRVDPPDEGELVVELADCGWFGPMAAAVLALVAERWAAKGLVVRGTAPTKERLAAYAAWSGIAERLGFGPPPADDPASLALPVRTFHQVDPGTPADVLALVRRSLPLDAATAEPLDRLVHGLGHNVETHAGAAGALTARVFPERGEVRVCVADLGRGLLVGQGLDPATTTDRQAVERAPKAHAPADGNLADVDAIVASRGGSWLLVSGKAARLRQGAKVRMSELPRGVRFPGTLHLVRYPVKPS